MPTKKLENKIKTLTLKFLNINSVNQSEQNVLVTSFDITEFASLISPENFIRIAYKRINEKLLTIEEYQLKYFGSTTKILCGIFLDNELIYQNFQYLDCRENYYKNTINNNKNICDNGVELDLNGQDCEYFDDGTNWEELAGFNDIQKEKNIKLEKNYKGMKKKLHSYINKNNTILNDDIPINNDKNLLNNNDNTSIDNDTNLLNNDDDNDDDNSIILI